MTHKYPLQLRSGKNNLLVGTLLGFGPVWFYPEGIANILSLALLVSDQFRVTMNTDIENAIYVHKDNRVRKSFTFPCNLYFCDMKESNTNILTIKTVELNEKEYSELDI